LSIGSSAYHVGLTINTQKQNIGTEIYINDDKELFERFKMHKDEISTMLNSEVEWREAKKACRIFITTNINPKKRDCWPKAYNWFLEKAIIYKEIASKFGE
jgi:hypothetical protein